MSDDVEVLDAPQRQRFEISVGEKLAGFTEYRPQGRVYAFVHTEIDPAFEGKGLGSILIRSAMDSMREQDIGVLPYCPFVKRFLQRHTEYVPLVPREKRRDFGLPVDDGDAAGT